MIGFAVSLNGRHLYTAGAGNRGVMSASVTWVFREAPASSRRPISGLTWVASRTARISSGRLHAS